MVLSVACVSAANAAFQSIDDFTIGGSAVGDYASRLSGGQLVDETGSFGLSGYRQLSGMFLSNTGGFNATAASNSSSSVVIGSGKVSMSYGGTKANSGTWTNNALGGTNYCLSPANGNYVSNQTTCAGWEVLGSGGTPSDWSTLTSLSFDIANYTKGGLLSANSPSLRLSIGYLTDPTDFYTGAFQEFAITLANGSVSLSNSQLTTAGVNLAGMLNVNLYLTNTYSTPLTTTAGVANIPTASLEISNLGVSGVPAPGAVALLGAAGLIGARRRRD